MVVLPAVGVVAVASEPVFHLLLSKKWGQAAPLFLLIAPAASLQPVTAILGTFLMALGRTDVQMRLAAQFAAVWLLGLMQSVWYGIEAVAAVYSVCALLFSVWSLRVCLPLLNCSFTAYERTLLWPLTACPEIVLSRIIVVARGYIDNLNKETGNGRTGTQALPLGSYRRPGEHSGTAVAGFRGSGPARSATDC
jgi:O-antigen/teichoic acid export membrane protein